MPMFDVLIPDPTESALLTALSAIGAVNYTPAFKQNVGSLVWFVLATPEGVWSLGGKTVKWETVGGVKSARVTG